MAEEGRGHRPLEDTSQGKNTARDYMLKQFKNRPAMKRKGELN